MDAFQSAFDAVMKNSATTGYAPPSPSLKTRRSYPDGQDWPNAQGTPLRWK
jgi:hypothetical protein